MGSQGLNLIQHSFSHDDQRAFAKLSGDYNPIHLDPVKARRTGFGQPVVHGMHALLWALEVFFTGKTETLKLVSLKTFFKQPIAVGEKFRLAFKNKDDNNIEIQILVRNDQALRITAQYSPRGTKNNVNFADSNPNSRECLERKPEELTHATGRLDLSLNKREAALRFPNLMRLLPSDQLAEMMALTKLVGMECPGLNSIFSDLNLDFSNPCEDSPYLNYKVLSYDSRFGLLTQNIQAPGLAGTLRAFVRPSPEYQSDFSELRKLVSENEFSGQTAIILGGSRGLGEVTGKLLAAGGAHVFISYYLGSEDAQNIVQQIQKEGGNAKCFAFNVLDLNSFEKEKILKIESPFHLYYFPTPLIFQGQKNAFSPELFQEFSNYYLTGFFNTFQTFQKLGSGIQGVFYPSSVAIDELPNDMAEYSVAKSAGETLCSILAKKYPEINIFAPRLPRTATDQTNSLLPTHREDPAPLMLKNLRNFRDKAIMEMNSI
ncbi:MAG: SDR family NAD(P)-dependent oxidoreductase [Nitrospinota bacterium]